jgi:hypothetical protein
MKVDLNELYPHPYGLHTGCDGVQLALVMSRVLKRIFRPSLVVDYGCGIGIWVKAFELLAVDAYGFEGAVAAVRNAVCNPLKIHLCDLREPVPMILSENVLAISLEVAEHVEDEFSDIYVDNVLSGDPNFVVFTSSPPGMEGHGHINLQPDEYWDSKFLKRGYIKCDALTSELKVSADSGQRGEILRPDEVGRGIDWFGMKDLCQNDAPEYDIWKTDKIFFPEWFIPNVRVFERKK